MLRCACVLTTPLPLSPCLPPRSPFSICTCQNGRFHGLLFQKTHSGFCAPHPAPLSGATRPPTHPAKKSSQFFDMGAHPVVGLGCGQLHMPAYLRPASSGPPTARDRTRDRDPIPAVFLSTGSDPGCFLEYRDPNRGNPDDPGCFWQDRDPKRGNRDRKLI